MSWRIRFTNVAYLRLGFAVIVLAFLTAGCTTIYDPESSQETNLKQIGIVSSTESFGQVIHAKRPQVTAINLWLSKANPEDNSSPAELLINLFDHPNSTNPFFSTRISTRSILQNSQIQIKFPPLQIPGQDSFYLELSSSGQEIQIHGCPEGCYPDGLAYQSQAPIQADMAFQLSYIYDFNALGMDIKGWISNAEFIFPLLATILLPGLTLMRVFRLNERYPLSEQLPLTIGLSLAFIPIIYLISSTFDLELTQDRVKLISLLFCVITIITILRHPRLWIRSLTSYLSSSDFLYLLCLLGILIFTLSIRFIMVRDLATPAWVDSAHHGLITRLIVHNGTLPQTYYPYMDIEPTLYHPGFHSGLAFFIQLSGMDIDQAMLYYGQALNALVVLSAYLLTSLLTRSPTAGLFAAIITGTFTPMPAYYTSWGRYPQLAGLIILPIPMALLFSTRHSSGIRNNISHIICAAIAFAGLFLVHYRVAAFLICLVAAYLLAETLVSRREWKNIITAYGLRIVYMGLLAALISSPWLIPAIHDAFLPRITPTNPLQSIRFFNDFSWHYLTPALGKQAMIMGAIGWLWAVLNKHRVAIIIPAWVILLFFLANLGALGLPGGNFINNSSVTIMLFLPISVSTGYLIDQLFISWKSLLNKSLHIVLVITFIFLSLLSSLAGSRQLISILNPTTILSRKADLTSIQWIDQNIPDDQIILINPFLWGYGLYSGSDGGTWIPALAGNPTIPPPVLYGLGSNNQKDHINQICQDIYRLGSSPDDLWQYLASNNIEYIYIGARGGPLSAEVLTSSDLFEIQYHNLNTWVIRLRPLTP